MTQQSITEVQINASAAGIQKFGKEVGSVINELFQLGERASKLAGGAGSEPATLGVGQARSEPISGSGTERASAVSMLEGRLASKNKEVADHQTHIEQLRSQVKYNQGLLKALNDEKRKSQDEKRPLGLVSYGGQDYLPTSINEIKAQSAGIREANKEYNKQITDLIGLRQQAEAKAKDLGAAVRIGASNRPIPAPPAPSDDWVKKQQEELTKVVSRQQSANSTYESNKKQLADSKQELETLMKGRTLYQQSLASGEIKRVVVPPTETTKMALLRRDVVASQGVQSSAQEDYAKAVQQREYLEAEQERITNLQRGSMSAADFAAAKVPRNAQGKPYAGKADESGNLSYPGFEKAIDRTRQRVVETGEALSEAAKKADIFQKKLLDITPPSTVIEPLTPIRGKNGGFLSAASLDKQIDQTKKEVEERQKKMNAAAMTAGSAMSQADLIRDNITKYQSTLEGRTDRAYGLIRESERQALYREGGGGNGKQPPGAPPGAPPGDEGEGSEELNKHLERLRQNTQINQILGTQYRDTLGASFVARRLRSVSESGRGHEMLLQAGDSATTPEAYAREVKARYDEAVAAQQAATNRPAIVERAATVAARRQDVRGSTDALLQAAYDASPEGQKAAARHARAIETLRQLGDTEPVRNQASRTTTPEKALQAGLRGEQATANAEALASQKVRLDEVTATMGELKGGTKNLTAAERKLAEYMNLTPAELRGFVEHQARTNAALAGFNKQVATRTDEIKQSMGLPTSGPMATGNPTRWQRWQARSSANPNAEASSFPSFGKFIGRHAMNTLGYAVPGIAIGIGFEEMRTALRESQQAQRSMSELRAQFEALGQTNQFSGFSNSVKGIASATGVAVSEVTQLGIAMKGVYGSTDQATIATKAVAEATVTMGLTLKEAQEDLIGVSQGFNDLAQQKGSAMTTINNTLLHLQDVTGVEAKSQLPGIADVASTANAAGFNFKTTASTLAAAEQRSGLSSATIGETFSKIITSLSSNPQLMAQTENILQGVPGANIPNNIASQGMSTQIQAIMGGLSHMLTQPGSSAEYSYILSQLGINSSALPAANALFSTGTKASQLAGSVVPGNRSEQEFNKQIDTLSGRMQQLRSDFTNMGVAVLNSAIGHAFTQVVNALGIFVGWVNKFNGLSGGMLSGFAAFAGVALLLKGLAGSISFTIDFFKALRTAIAADTVATEANATAQGAGGLGGLFGKLGGKTAVASESGAVARGLFGTSVGAGVGEAGLGGGAAVGLGGGLLAVGAGYAAYQGTSALLNGFFGPGAAFGHAKNVPAVAQAAQSTTDVSNFVKKYRNLLRSEIDQHGTPAEQGAVIANNPSDLDLEHIYNTAAGNGEVPSIGNLMQQTDVRNTFAAAAKDPKVAAYLKAQAAQQKAQQAFLSSPYAHVLNYLNKLNAVNNIQNTDVTAVPQAYSTGNINESQAVSVLTKQKDTLLQAFRSNPSQAGWEAYLQAQAAVNQQLNTFAQQQQQIVQATLSSANPQNSLTLIASAQTVLTTAIKSKDPSAVVGAWTAYVSTIQTAAQTASANANNAADALAALTQSHTVTGPDGKPTTIQGPLAGQPKAQAQVAQPFIAAQQALSATQGYINPLTRVASASDPVAQAKAAVAAAQANIANLAKVGDTKQSDVQNAQAALAQANQQLRDASVATTVAQNQMYAVMFSNAPLQAAQYTLKALQSQLGNAHSAAEYSQISGQIAQTQQEIAQDTVALSDAQSSITQATLTARGNPIAAALTKYKQDLRDIASRKSFDAARGVNQSQDVQLQSQIAQSISDNTGYLQTQFSTLQNNTQAELYLGQITATQAISQLQAGMENAKGNQQLVLQYEQAIRQIQNSAGANLNFNIPQNLLVQPSLYQAVRLQQTGPGASYDQRSVQVNIQVSNSSQNPGAVQQLLTAIGGPQTGSVTSSPLASGI